MIHKNTKKSAVTKKTQKAKHFATKDKYYVMVDYVIVLLDHEACTSLSDYILKCGSTNNAIMAFAHHLSKLVKSGDIVVDPEMIYFKDKAHLIIGHYSECIQMLLDADFCIALVDLIETNGTSNIDIKRILWSLSELKECKQHRIAEAIKAMRGSEAKELLQLQPYKRRSQDRKRNLNKTSIKPT